MCKSTTAMQNNVTLTFETTENQIIGYIEDCQCSNAGLVRDIPWHHHFETHWETVSSTSSGQAYWRLLSLGQNSQIMKLIPKNNLMWWSTVHWDLMPYSLHTNVAWYFRTVAFISLHIKLRSSCNYPLTKYLLTHVFIWWKNFLYIALKQINNLL